MKETYTLDQISEVLYQWFLSQSFEDWYNEDFENHMEGEENCKSKKDIQKDISQNMKVFLRS